MLKLGRSTGSWNSSFLRVTAKNKNKNQPQVKSTPNVHMTTLKTETYPESPLKGSGRALNVTGIFTTMKSPLWNGNKRENKRESRPDDQAIIPLHKQEENKQKARYTAWQWWQRYVFFHSATSQFLSVPKLNKMLPTGFLTSSIFTIGSTTQYAKNTQFLQYPIHITQV